MDNGKIILMDGAVGTSLWEKTDDRGPVWRYNITNPEIVTELHKEYIAAGSEIILTNTFGANAPAVRRSSEYSVDSVVSTGVALAKEAARNTKTKVALAIGPLSTLLEPYGDTTEEEAAQIFSEMISAGMREKPDLIYIQTFIDLSMMEIAAKEALKSGLPVLCSMSFEKVGKTIMGNSVKDMIDTLEPLGVSAVGLNCSLGPDIAIPIIREFADNTEMPLVFKPNAGKPILSENGETSVPYSPEIFTRDIRPAFKIVKYIGGCCGSNAAYIRRLREEMCDKLDEK